MEFSISGQKTCFEIGMKQTPVGWRSKAGLNEGSNRTDKSYPTALESASIESSDVNPLVHQLLASKDLKSRTQKSCEPRWSSSLAVIDGDAPSSKVGRKEWTNACKKQEGLERLTTGCGRGLRFCRAGCPTRARRCLQRRCRAIRSQRAEGRPIRAQASRPPIEDKQ
jgi:hypothetical protein